MQPGSLIVEIDRCGIGGSDLDAFRSGEVPAPAWFGHEWAGRVVAVGDGVTDHFEGEPVVGSAPPACGSCRTCTAGLADHCRRVLDMIVGTDDLADGVGGFAQRIRVDHRRVHRLPEGIDMDDAALAEPASRAVHALNRAQIQIGDIVAVVGAGSVGLLVAELARLAGAARVLVLDPDPDRQELACVLGADAAFGPGDATADWLARAGHGLGADVVFDCAKSSDSLARAVDMARQGGHVVAVGVAGGVRAAMPSALIDREVTLTASLAYTVADVRRALVLMAEDRLRVDAIVDGPPLTLDEAATRFPELADRESGRPKVLVAPSG